MTPHPSKLAAARLAAAEVFIADGMTGTDWEQSGADALRNLADRRGFRVARTAGAVNVGVRVDDAYHDGFKVHIEPMWRSRLTPKQADDLAALLRWASEITRKVEAAIAEAAGEEER